MINWRNNIWIFPIIGAIFAIISLFTPVMFSICEYESWWDGDFTEFVNIWMVGYWFDGINSGWINGLPDVPFISFNATHAPFIFSFIGLLFGAILGIRTGVLGYRGDFRRNIAALSGLLMIFSMLIFLLWVEIDWKPFSGDTVRSLEISVDYQSIPGFGLIGPFIGGIFCLAGVSIQSRQ
ncbi:MAG: hypothetical protein ACFFA0_14090 [Promethearchaeota archaeon]